MLKVNTKIPSNYSILCLPIILDLDLLRCKKSVNIAIVLVRVSVELKLGHLRRFNKWTSYKALWEPKKTVQDPSRLDEVKEVHKFQNQRQRELTDRSCDLRSGNTISSLKPCTHIFCSPAGMPHFLTGSHREGKGQGSPLDIAQSASVLGYPAGRKEWKVWRGNWKVLSTAI